MQKQFNITLNQELQGVEVIFESKPDQLVLDFLKNNRFRWNRKKEVWYTKQTSMLLDVDSFGECLDNLIEKGEVGVLESAWKPKGTNTTVNYKPVSYDHLIRDAIKASNDAGNKKMQDLRGAGPQHAVIDHSLGGANGQVVDTMLDLVGFVECKILQKKVIAGDNVRNLDFIKFIKNKGERSENWASRVEYIYETKHGSLRLSKSYDVGFFLYLNDAPEIVGVERQYIQPKVASYRAFQGVLDSAEIMVSVRDWLD